MVIPLPNKNFREVVYPLPPPNNLIFFLQKGPSLIFVQICRYIFFDPHPRFLGGWPAPPLIFTLDIYGFYQIVVVVDVDDEGERCGQETEETEKVERIRFALLVPGFEPVTNKKEQKFGFFQVSTN